MQLPDNKTSLASHVDKLHAFEAVFVEHSTIQCHIRQLLEKLRAMMRASGSQRGKTAGEPGGGVWRHLYVTHIFSEYIA